MALSAIRKSVYLQLEPDARRSGLSLINKLLVILVIIAVVEAVAGTEPALTQGRERIFADLELAIGIIFLVEYVARLWIAVDNPKFAKSRFPRLRYAMTPIAIIDLLAVLPALFAFGGAPTLVLRFFRVLRILRLAKLGRMSKAMKDIRWAIYQRRYEFALILGILGITILLSASLLYLAEAEAQPEKFGSIPRSLWWAIVTLTTVGYGDAYPVTALGKFLAGVIAITGVTVIALPTGIFAASFSDAMDHRKNGSDGKRGGGE